MTMSEKIKWITFHMTEKLQADFLNVYYCVDVDQV